VRKEQVPTAPSWSRELFTVGVTGTNGKTTTTTYLAAALARLKEPAVRVTTLGFFLGDRELFLPKDWSGFLCAMRDGLDAGGKYAAIELTSEALARGFAAAWPCSIGVFTNLTHDHLDAHKSPEHYLASKAQLFMHLPQGGTAVLNACDPASELVAEVVPQGVEIVTYGVAARGEAWRVLDLGATSIDVTWEGTRIALEGSARLGDLPAEMTIRAHGAVYAENAMAALLAAIRAGAPARAAVAAISAAETPPGRFEVVARAPYVVVDYAHSPDALGRTLAGARPLCKGRLTVVFGAGGDRDRDKRAPMGQAAAAADRVILTTDNPRSEDPKEIAVAIRMGLAGHDQVEIVLDRASAIERAVGEAGAEDVVLIAGKGHERDQTIGVSSRPFSDKEVALAALARRG
jgi:UDP-N-acetylmuramoyl-L-alanyl-D-glutamate--2,6-diaminopimelate ligase